jgi:murein DD-endopeptidase MepM/ murein hydrolase activator NlpD
MILRTIKALTATALLTLATVPVFAQDMLARQAPIDRKMKAVDSLALQRLISNEQAQSSAGEVYADWDNHYAHRTNSAIPDSFRIDLRHFCMPTPSRVITSNFGHRWGREHKGLDIKVYIGDTIRAAFSGKVRIVRYEAAGYGNYIVVRHANGLETIYGHLSKQLVDENQEVRAGEPIGLGGNTGRSTGSHLHFETRFLGIALNPALMFDFPDQDVTNDFFTFRKSSYEHESAVASSRHATRAEQRETASNDDNSVVNDGVTRFHKVSTGETLFSIARKRGTTVESICKLNHIGRNFRVIPGQILRYS